MFKFSLLFSLYPSRIIPVEPSFSAGMSEVSQVTVAFSPETQVSPATGEVTVGLQTMRDTGLTRALMGVALTIAAEATATARVERMEVKDFMTKIVMNLGVCGVERA